MKLHFLGAAHEVTGSCTLIEAAGKRILVDCGMEQGADIYENAALPVAASQLDAVLLTHAHIDHSGKIPMLVAQGFQGEIFTTAATASLCRIMLMDSAHIQEFEAEWRNRKAKRGGQPEYVPLYTAADVQKTIPLLHPCDYNSDYTICDGITVSFTDAGHLLGSASITVAVTENGQTETLLFSGDVGNIQRPLIRDPQTPPAADYVVVESTYGNRTHGDRPDYVAALTDILQRTFDRGGNVVVPCFAIGRTQEMLYLLRQIQNDALVQGHPHFTVWVDSPLAVEATGIYNGGLHDYYDEETLALLAEGENPIQFAGLKLSVTSDDSRAINFDKTPKVILSASGMCEAGRIRHHLKHNLWRPESTVLFVGYQSEGTIGRKLVDGAETVKLFGEEIRVRAEIATLAGISGHADRDMLLRWLKAVGGDKKQVFVNHGEDKTCDAFAATVTAQLHFPASAPYNGAIYDTAADRYLTEGNKTYLEKKSFGARAADSIYHRLVAAGRRLMTVIEKNRGTANKDLAKFADQITKLADKWER